MLRLFSLIKNKSILKYIFKYILNWKPKIVQTSVPKTDVCPTASVLPKMQPSGIQSDVSLGDKHRAYAELGG